MGTKTNKILLLIAFSLIFVFLGVSAMRDSMPEARNKRVYTLLKPYIPYVLEKRVQGLSIVDRDTKVKEEPPSSQVYLRLDQLEKQWGKKYLKLDKNTLNIYNKDKKVVKKIKLDKEELKWVKTFFSL